MQTFKYNQRVVLPSNAEHTWPEERGHWMGCTNNSHIVMVDSQYRQGSTDPGIREVFDQHIKPEVNSELA